MPTFSSLIQQLQRLGRGRIATIAGAGYRDGVPARDAPSGWTLGVVRMPDGDLVVADYKGNRLWRIDGEGILHTFAGDGVPGDDGDGGPAIDARVYGPHDLALDRHGNLYFSDLWNNCYRRIDHETGVITRIAGSGRMGRGGTGGPAVDAEIDTTSGIAIDDRGNIYLSGEWDNNIRRIDAGTGTIEVFAGQEARHYPSEEGTRRPYTGRLAGTTFSWETGLSLGGYHGDGGPARDAGFFHPEHVAFDSKGDLYVCDNSNNRIRKIDMKTGIVTTFLGDGRHSSQGDGGPAVEASVLMPDSLCIDAHDNIYVGEKYGYRVRRVDDGDGNRVDHRGHWRARLGRGGAARLRDPLQLMRVGHLGRSGRHGALERLLWPPTKVRRRDGHSHDGPRRHSRRRRRPGLRGLPAGPGRDMRRPRRPRLLRRPVEPAHPRHRPPDGDDPHRGG